MREYELIEGIKWKESEAKLETQLDISETTSGTRS